MSILTDRDIRELCIKPENASDDWKPMISDYIPHQVREVEGEKCISWGSSSMGYDVRLDRQFKIFTNINSSIIDPLNFDHNTYVDFEGDKCIIPPHSYALGITMETFVIPKNIMVICLGKSTYARAGCLINVTPIEPSMVGKIVIEISNGTSLPLVIRAGHGIAQFLFFKADTPCDVSYADRGGKYMEQQSIVTPIG